MKRLALLVLGLCLSVGALAETKVLKIGQNRSNGKCDPKSNHFQLKEENSRKNDYVTQSLKMLELCRPSPGSELTRKYETAARECKALFNKNAGQKNELDNWADCTQSLKRFASALQAGPAAPAPAAAPKTAPAAAQALSTGDAEADGLLEKANAVLKSKDVSPTKRMKVKGPSDNVRNLCKAGDKAKCAAAKKALEAALK